jgi:hemerythrin-like domain-containing protein
MASRLRSPQRDANERTTNTAHREENVMNAIQLLKNEHETAKRAFGQIQAASAEQRAALWAKLQPELKVHEEIEEAALYGPVADEVGSRDETLKEWQGHHLEEVGELEALIQELDGTDPASDEWMEGIEELQQTLEHHIQEEEGDIWPRIQRAWDQSKLEHAGEKMEALKRQKMPRAA